MQTFNVAEEDVSKRLDVFVAEHMPDLSRAFVRKLSDDQKIQVNVAFQKASYKLRAKDKVTVDFNPKVLDQIPAIDLPVIYQDNDVIVINKPIGVLSHSKGVFNPEPTVATWLQQITSGTAKISPLSHKNREGIVHRLDRATSGVMICAKNKEAGIWLRKQFSTRKVKKAYVAIVKGHLDPPEAVIDMPIERNPKAPATFRVGSNGKPAITTYKVIQSSDMFDLVQLEPQTGRTHQLRVHLAYQKRPIVGDTLYGGEEAERLFLHAKSLELTLPSRQRKVFEAPVPDEFKIFLEQSNE